MCQLHFSWTGGPSDSHSSPGHLMIELYTELYIELPLQTIQKLSWSRMTHTGSIGTLCSHDLTASSVVLVTSQLPEALQVANYYI